MSQSLPNGECKIEAFHPEQVEKATSCLVSIEDARDIARGFQALGHPARLQLLSALHATELCVCDLAQVLGLSVATVSHHLKELRNAGLVTFRTEGRMAYYSLRDNPTLNYFIDAVTPCEHVSAETRV